MQEINAKLTSQLDAAHKQLEALQTDNKKLAANLSNAAQEIKQHLQTINDLGLSLKESDKKYKQSQEELKQSKEIAFNMERDIKRLTIKLGDKKQKCKKLKHSLESLQQLYDKDTSTLKTQMLSLEETFSTEKKGLLARIKQLEYDLEMLKVPKEPKVVHDDKELIALKVKLENAEKALKETQQDHDKLKKRYNELKEEHSPCKERLDLALVEIKKLQSS